MKHTLTAMLAMAALFAVPPARSSAAVTPQMASLNYIIGTWHCSWTAGDQSGNVDQVFEPVFGGTWIEERELAPGPDGKNVLASIHYTGYDAKEGEFVHVGPDAKGGYEFATSADAHVWHDRKNPGPAFLLDRISDTEQIESETFMSDGKPVQWRQTCRKVSAGS